MGSRERGARFPRVRVGRACLCSSPRRRSEKGRVAASVPLCERAKSLSRHLQARTTLLSRYLRTLQLLYLEHAAKTRHPPTFAAWEFRQRSNAPLLFRIVHALATRRWLLVLACLLLLPLALVGAGRHVAGTGLKLRPGGARATSPGPGRTLPFLRPRCCRRPFCSSSCSSCCCTI